MKHLTTILLGGLLALLTACEDKLPDEPAAKEGTGTVTLTFTASPQPMVHTKSEVRDADKGSEADKAGFSYEMVVTAIDTIQPDSKSSPNSNKYKNAIALLFASNGAFNGRATIGAFEGGKPITTTFTGVTNTTDKNCRIVLVALDNEATTVAESLVTASKLSTYNDTYSKFCDNVNGPHFSSSSIKTDADIPYVGSITGVNLNANSTTNNIPLYRMLSKVISTVKVDAPDIKRYLVIFQGNHSYCSFGTPNEYDGSGNTKITQVAGAGEDIELPGSAYTVFYGGEIIRPDIKVDSFQDRSRTKAGGAAVIYVGLQYQSDDREHIEVGEQYSSNEYFFLYVYLGNGDVSDFSLRRNHAYDVTINIRGTRSDFVARSTTDRRINISSEGLCVGYLGGFVASANGTNFSNVKGHYTKKLLLEPNNSRKIGTLDSETYVWNANAGSTAIQPEGRRYWDYSYIQSVGNGTGGMSNVAGSAYYYCKTLGSKWYVPTLQQLAAIMAVLKDNPAYDYYTGFAKSYYWSSTERSATAVWVEYWSGFTDYTVKESKLYVRCVRDI